MVVIRGGELTSCIIGNSCGRDVEVQVAVVFLISVLIRDLQYLISSMMSTKCRTYCSFAQT